MTVRSEVWNYFNKDEEGRVTCKYCLRQFSRKDANTTQLWAHIRSLKHVDLLQQEHNRSSKFNEDFASAITAFFVRANIPFSSLSFPEFASFVRFLNASTPLPSPQSLTHGVLPKMADAYRTEVLQMLFGNGAQEVAITIDEWRSPCGTLFVACSAHLIDMGFTRRNLLVTLRAFPDSTPDAIYSRLSHQFSSIFASNSILCVVKDNEKNMQWADRTWDPSLFNVIPCLVRQLYRVLDDSVSQCEDATRIIAYARAVRLALSTSKKLRHMYREQLKAHGIPVSRILVDHHAEENIIELLVAIQSTLPIIQMLVHVPVNKAVDGNDLTRLLEILLPIKELVQQLVAEDAACSLVIPILGNLKMRFERRLSREDAFASSFLKACHTSISRLFDENVQFSPFLGNATYVDPRFAFLPFLSPEQWDTIESRISAKLDNGNADIIDSTPKNNSGTDTDDLWDDFIPNKKVKHEKGQKQSVILQECIRYRTLVQSDRPPPRSDLFSFWRSACADLPHLTDFARHHLSTPPSTLSVHSLLEESGMIARGTFIGREQGRTLDHVLTLHCRGFADRPRSLTQFREQKVEEPVGEEVVSDDDDGSSIVKEELIGT